MLKQFKHLNYFVPKHQRIVDSSDHRMPHMIYFIEQAQNLKVQHIQPVKLADWIALFNAKVIKTSINLIKNGKIFPMTQKRWLTRTLLLETIGTTLGSVGSICRHMRSLRLLTKDQGWIQHLVQESDNQRFHYFTVLNLRKPGYITRIMLMLMQGIFASQFLLGYMLSSRYGHKFIGYLEQEAFRHYTDILMQIDRKGGVLWHWNTKVAPQQTIKYYKLNKTASMRDVVLMIRADELSHNKFNHFMGEVDKNYSIDKQQEIMYKDSQKEFIRQKIQ